MIARMLSDLQESINGRRRVYLVRHGNVSYFDERGKPYDQDSVPLDQEGVVQAKALGRCLDPLAIDRLVVSGLPRTVETAELVAAGRELKLEMHQGLREISPGPLADIPREDLEREFTMSLSGDLSRQTRFLGGETFGSLEDRVLACLRTLLEDTDWNSLLIVAHGGTNRIILGHALGAGLRGAGTIEQDPACLNIVDVNRDGTFVVRLLNYTPGSPAKDGLHLTTMEAIYMKYLADGRE